MACSHSRFGRERGAVHGHATVLGNKSLDHRLDQDGLAFASEPKAFLVILGVHRDAESGRSFGLPDLPVR